jgi:uncharacterized protein YjiS (DUF1127 family)
MNRFTRVFSGVADGIRTARIRHTLGRMSDRQLADIGFNRDTIAHQVRELARVR